jgi:hypothetical protein
MMNPMRSFFQANPVQQSRPMIPTMGSAIRGALGGGMGRSMGGGMAGAMGGSLGQTIRGMAQAPDRTGGIGQAVSAMRAPGAVSPVIRTIGARMGMGRMGR